VRKQSAKLRFVAKGTRIARKGITSTNGSNLIRDPREILSGGDSCHLQKSSGTAVRSLALGPFGPSFRAFASGRGYEAAIDTIIVSEES